MKRIMLLSLAFTFSMAFAQEKVCVGKFETKSTKGWKSGHQTHKWEERVCEFDVKNHPKYTVLYNACVDDAQHPGFREPPEDFIGMPSPHVFNWYHHGFFRVKINDKVPFQVPLKDMTLLTQGGKKMVMQMVWDAPEALLHIKFMRLLEDDALYVRTIWYPKENVEIKNVQFTFTCYPCTFEKDGNHFAKTKTAIEYQNKKPLTLDMKLNDYVFYGDKRYDAVTSKTGMSTPCYLVFDKHRLASGSVSISSYAVVTTINANPNAREARFLFADAHDGQKCKEVIDYLEKNAAAMQDKLMKVSFNNPAMDEFVPEAAQKEIEALAKTAGDFSKPYIGKLNNTLAKLREAKKNVNTAESWIGERDFAKSYEEYMRLFMRLKIDAMMQLE